jgi:hypothetical protein
LTGDEIPRLVHTLGPRYCGNFQDPDLIKFLTYENATSLNVFLSNAAAKSSSDVPPLLKAIKEGMALSESSILFSITPLHWLDQSCRTVRTNANGSSRDCPNIFKIEGDVLAVKVSCLDISLWKIGGAAVALRLVQMTSVSIRSVLWIES